MKNYTEYVISEAEDDGTAGMEHVQELYNKKEVSTFEGFAYVARYYDETGLADSIEGFADTKKEAEKLCIEFCQEKAGK